MSRGQHAADDGSFSRSAGGAMARGIMLIVVAVLLGVVLLNATDDPEPFARASDEESDDQGATPTTEPAGGDEETTSTSAPAVARDPSEVTVYVVNGSGVRGAAGSITERLKGSTYITVDPGNIDVVDSSRVYFTPGYEADAAAVAGLLTPPPAVEALPDPPPVDDLQGAQVLVVVAADLAGG